MSWIEKPRFEIFGDFNLTELYLDQAYLNVTNLCDEELFLYRLSTDCFECPYRFLQEVEMLPNSSSQIVIGTKFPVQYRFRRDKADEFIFKNDADPMKYCDIDATFGEFGIYDLVADPKHSDKCYLETQLKAVNIYYPLIIVGIFYLLLTLVLILWNKSDKIKVTKAKSMSKFGHGIKIKGHKETEGGDQPPLAKKRLQSLDTFRGMCIIIMIFVNDGGAGYYFFEHATWDGLYVADLVFPWFLWIMGVCIPVSIKSQLRRKTPKLEILQGITIRSLKLVGIGLMLASRVSAVDIEKFRLPGVLQRFGVCYFVAAGTMLICGNDDFVNNKLSKNKFLQQIQPMLFLWKGWIISLAVLGLHTCLTFLLEVPGCPTGYLGPGGLHLVKDIEKYPTPSLCIGGASGYIDRQVLTPSHIFLWPTALETYKASAYDPEGILGTLTSIFQVWLGVNAGMILQTYSTHSQRLVRWGFWAILTGGLGAALCGLKETGGLIPINKNLWSLSYVMATTSFALCLLIVLYLVIDWKGWWSGTPFLEPGMNSILLYVGHSVCHLMLPFHFGYIERFKTHFLLLVESLWGTSLWVIIAIYLHKVKYFWSL